MKISTKGRYGLRIMLDLALSPRGKYISIKEISGRQDISDKYMEQIITQLNRAGFVKSVRGAHGGYCLARDPKEYTVGMVLRLMEGDLAPVACLEAGAEECKRCSQCVTVEVWQKLQEAMDNVVDHITLADLVARHKEKNALTDPQGE